MNFTRNSIIVHVHGGGFIAMSSTTHENYLRKWTNNLGVPIFSIDYRLAPENPYPKSLDDVWQAYNWIVNNAAQEFEIEIDRIILVGDSAGGNLVLGLVYLLIVMQKRIPDALFLAYPGINKKF
jgi:hormone-sensitive lipase